MTVDSNDLDRLSTDEAGILLALNREQVVRRIQQGMLEGGKDLGRWFVIRRSVREYLANQPTPEPAA